MAEPLAQMLRLVGSGLKFCRQRLKYGSYNSKFEIAENEVQVCKTTSGSSLLVFYIFTSFPIAKKKKKKKKKTSINALSGTPK